MVHSLLSLRFFLFSHFDFSASVSVCVGVRAIPPPLFFFFFFLLWIFSPYPIVSILVPNQNDYFLSWRWVRAPPLLSVQNRPKQRAICIIFIFRISVLQIFMAKSAMQMHARDAHRSETKPHQCQQCLKSFSSNHQLVQHIRVHTGEKPYRCSYCDRRFKQLSHVQQHTRLHTGKPLFLFIFTLTFFFFSPFLSLSISLSSFFYSIF